eukprot:CAMPEP_0195607414 /NCGR_PEP_ID=MMETSP0815-20121206/8204_1 /TAXON_ID=97485 /ORGANISM="Prymnesium parvum, Strain Texoma1" /LENGTH=212 /DNA_ID=CAMNT_0040747217 /DNA_START=1 /DNA_END=635 /DNA_ORIENTATION=+
MSARPDECAQHLADRVRQLEDAIAVLSKRQSQLELELLSKRGTAEPNEGAPAPKSEMATIKSSEPARVHESDAARTTANQLASGSDTAQSSSQPRMRSGPYAGSRSWGASITQLTFLVGGMRGIYIPCRRHAWHLFTCIACNHPRGRPPAFTCGSWHSRGERIAAVQQHPRMLPGKRLAWDLCAAGARRTPVGTSPTHTCGLRQTPHKPSAA